MADDERKRQLSDFLEDIRTLVEDSYKTYGNNSFPGVTTTSKEVGYRLQTAALVVAEAYSQGTGVSEESEKVRAELLSGQVLGVVNQQQVDRILDKLNNLMEK
ncbi:MAG: hypothetical protein JWP13_381 [Candidatus Saccharibacteria bacterium]|nr:hypothetical protein [Candidatus Saccharibacteria bacterium]